MRFVARNKDSLSTTALDGGIMIYAKRTSDQFVKSTVIPNSSSNPPEPFVLPNGSYEFSAVGWGSSGMVGQPKCGYDTSAGPISLSGQDATITISLDDATCSTSFFNQNPDFANGGSINELDLYFCGEDVDTSAFVGGNDCTSGKESSRLLSGLDSGHAGIDRVELDSHTNRMVYSSAQHTSSRIELFSVDINGVAVKQSGVPSDPAFFDVNKFEVVPNSGKVVFMATTASGGIKELFISTIGSQGATKISQNPGALTGLKDFSVAGNYVVYAAEMETVGEIEVYSVNLNTLAAPVKLSDSAPAGTGVFQSGGYYLFDTTPNNTHVIFAGYFDSATVRKLYKAPVNGAANSATLMHTAPTNPTFEVNQFKITDDGLKIIWIGDFYTESLFELYMSQITDGPASTPEKISSAVAGTAVQNEFFLSDDTTKIAFSQDETMPDRYDLYTADIGTTSLSNVTMVHSTGSNTSDYLLLKFNEDKTKIVYLSDQITNGTYKIFSATVGDDASEIDRSHTNYTITAPTPGDGETYFLITPDDMVITKADDSVVSPGFDSLYKFSLANGSPATLFSQPRAANLDVKDFVFGDGKLFYIIDDLVDDDYEIFKSDIGLTSYERISIPTSPDLTGIKGLHFNGANSEHPNDYLAGFPKALFVISKPPGSASIHDMYAFTDYTNPSTFRRVTKNYSPPGGPGAGRFKFSLLKYESSASGNLSTSSNGISSSCLAGPTIDGDAISLFTDHGIYMPSGSGGGSGPFAMALDIFPSAYDCNGSPHRIIFPHGLSSYGSSPASAKIKYVLNSGDPAFYIND